MAPRRLRRRVSFSKKKNKKVHILQSLTNSKSVGNSSIIMDAFIYILKLKLQLEELKKYLLVNIIQEVKVDKLHGRRFMVKVRCKKVQDLFVSILEAFEEMDISVVQARVSCCNYLFSMEAIVDEAEDHQGLFSVEAVTQAIQKAIQRQSEIAGTLST